MKKHIVKIMTVIMAAALMACVSGCSGKKSSEKSGSSTESSTSKYSQLSGDVFSIMNGSTQGGSVSKSTAAGKWSYTYDSRGEKYTMSLELYKDGSAKFVSDESTDSAEGTWTVSGNKISFKEKNSGTVSEFTYSNRTLTLNMGSQDIVFKKDAEPLESEESKEKESAEKHEHSAEVSFEFQGHTDAQYAGDWKAAYSKEGLSLTEEDDAALNVMYDDVVITLNADGTAKTVFMSEEMEGKWESSGDVVNIILDGQKEKFKYNDGVLTGTTDKRLTLVKQ